MTADAFNSSSRHEVRQPAPLLVDERDARRLLGNVSAKSLFNWRRNHGLPFVKLGSRTMYCPEDLAAWIDQRKQKGASHE